MKEGSMRPFVVASMCVVISIGAGAAAAQTQCVVAPQSIWFNVTAQPALTLLVQAGGVSAHPLQIDTGSTGIVLGYMHIGTKTPLTKDELTQLGLKDYILYNSSDKVMEGQWVHTSIELSDGSHSVTIPSIPVLSVNKMCTANPGQTKPPFNCQNSPKLPVVCSKNAGKAAAALCNLGMMGVGFDRGTPMVPSAVNPFLNLQPMKTNPPSMQRGYIITATEGITLGMTESDIENFTFLKLTSLGEPGEWQQASGCVAITGGGINDPGKQVCGDILMDTGVDTMFVTYAKGFLPTFNPAIPASGRNLWNCAATKGVPPPWPCNASSAGVSVTWPGAIPKPFTYSVSAPAQFVANGTNPASVHVGQGNSLSPPENVFVNTSRQLLYAADYLYDATCGRIGFRSPPSIPVRQH
jgi:hypothetical protein